MADNRDKCNSGFGFRQPSAACEKYLEGVSDNGDQGMLTRAAKLGRCRSVCFDVVTYVFTLKYSVHILRLKRIFRLF